jgi:hypothetical protein
MSTATCARPVAHPNNEFIGACLAFDALMEQLHDLRSKHFGVEPEAQRTWQEVLDVQLTVRQIAKALTRFNGAKA